MLLSGHPPEKNIGLKLMNENKNRLQSANWRRGTRGALTLAKRLSFLTVRTAIVLAIVLLSVSTAWGARPTLSPDLVALIAKSSPRTMVRVIVQYKSKPWQADYDQVRQRGGKLNRNLFSIRAATVSLPLSGVVALSKSAHVSYISLDRQVSMSLDYVTKAVNADIAWSYGYDGSNVGIAVIDSGIYSHPDLNQEGSTQSRVVYSESFVVNDPSVSDAYGHGTHVAGIAAGNGQNAAGYKGEYRGIAPNANIINLRVLDANGRGNDSAVVAAIQRAIELKGQYNIRVLNLSLGRKVFESYTLDPLAQAVEQAWKAGIVVVVAAGNYGRDYSGGKHGYATIAAPGNDPYVITVGAMNMGNTYVRSDDTIASYSSKGPSLIDHIAKPDLVAPGNSVVSLFDPGATLETQHSNLNVYPCDTTGKCNSTVGSPQYFRLSGTSMATPVVAGAAALMLQKDPTLTPDLVKARMMKTSYKGFSNFSSSMDGYGFTYNAQADIFTYGAGYLDVAAALANGDMASGVAVSPTAVYNPLTRTVTLQYNSSVPTGTSVVWGTSVIWGTSVVWGTNVFLNSSSVLWGNSVVWGTSSNTGFSVIWGSSVVWGTNDSEAFSGDDGDCAIDPVTGLSVCQ